MKFTTIDGHQLNVVPPATRYTINFDQLHGGLTPVTECEGCGRPLYVPHIDVPGIRCHWCSDNAIAYRAPR